MAKKPTQGKGGENKKKKFSRRAKGTGARGAGGK